LALILLSEREGAMGQTDRDYADKPSDAVEFLNTCAIVLAVVVGGAGIGIVGYAAALFFLSLPL
jgi:hypothetical protein